MASASTALKAAATGQQVATTSPQDKPKTIAGLLTDPAIKQQLALALPKHMTADRLARIALTEVRKNAKLGQCDQASFLGAIMQCASLGLEPGGALGHAYLLPFDKRAKVNGTWQVTGTDVQLIVGYRGMIDLARRSGQILSLEARVVYEADHFEVAFGLDSKLVHEPAWDRADRGRLTFVYAVAKLKDGGTQFEVMSAAEINAIRDASQGFKAAVQAAEKYNKDPDSPWHKHYDEMAKKTVIRRLFKYLPVSIEIQRAVGLDEQAEAGIPQGNPLVIEGQFSHVTDEPQAAGNDEGNIGALTQGEIIVAMESARDVDELNAAYDLVRMLSEADRPEITKAYAARLEALQ